MGELNINVLLGKRLSAVDMSADKSQIDFTASDGERFRMYHSQDCCESVYVEDVAGDFSDLIGNDILMAEESTNSKDPVPEHADESFTWTFYKLSTIKGSVTIRWLGSSNGYYSESVSFARMP